MKVKDLKEALGKLPEDLEVYIMPQGAVAEDGSGVFCTVQSVKEGNAQVTPFDEIGDGEFSADYKRAVLISALVAKVNRNV
jgi:hypothetical protein